MYWVDAISFSDRAYLLRYQDVATAVARGFVRSGYEHYHRYGKWEGRAYPVRPWVGPCIPLLAWFEATLRRLLAVLNPWELWPRLRAEGKYALGFPGGPSNMDRYRAGPWVAELHSWHRALWVMLEVRVESQSELVHCTVQPLAADGDALGSPLSLECVSLRLTKRVLRLPHGTAQLRLRCSLDGVPARPLSLRLRPLTESRAARLLQRRLRRGSAPTNLTTAPQGRKGDLEPLWAAYEQTFPLSERPTYEQWIRRVEQLRLQALDREAPSSLAALARRPLVSVLVPTYGPAPAVLRECIDSVLEQSYENWELCIVDDASPDDQVRRILRDYQERDARIRVRFRETNGHISRATNDALEMARGDFVALLDHDDTLSRHALFHVVCEMNAHPAARLLYSDEDKLSATGDRRDPHFKPEFDPDRLLGQNYIAHFLVVDRRLLLDVGALREGYEGSQDHDLVLRVTERLDPSEIAHIPEVLYHWRAGRDSTAGSVQHKPYALEAGLRAVQSAVSRRALDASAEIDSQAACYHVEWGLPDPAPLVSVIIPTRDGVELLRRCVETLLEATDYPDLEVLIVDNGSRLPSTRQFFAKASGDSRVRILGYDRPFNFSAINNFAVRHASGDILVLLNNDIEIVEKGWLREMISHAVRPEIGCVGAKLLYPDGRIQHAGVVLGVGGVAGHAFKYADGDCFGYFSKLRMTHSVSAVTAACLAVRRAVFDQVGGMDEVGLKVAFNDVDFCLRVREAGYRNVLTPHAVLVHHESATRGSDDDESRRERFASERNLMRERWGEMLFTDPYYSPHLTLDHEDFSLRLRY